MSNEGVTILDGGMGHELKLRGISDGTFLAGVLANENFACDNDVVESIHRDYLASGCDVITTNSFIAVSCKCKRVPQLLFFCLISTSFLVPCVLTSKS